MLRVSNVNYKDCRADDFSRYFGHTIMMYRISPNKNRVAIVRPINDGRIPLRYLTIKKEWKDKTIPFEGWDLALVPITHTEFWFNMPSGCAVWLPDTGRVLFKSLHSNIAGLKRWGSRNLEESSHQGLMFYAFEEFYRPVRYYTLDEILKIEGREATVSCGGFVLDHTKKDIFLKDRKIGKYGDDGCVHLPKSKEVLVNILVNSEKVPLERIKLK